MWDSHTLTLCPHALLQCRRGRGCGGEGAGCLTAADFGTVAGSCQRHFSVSSSCCWSVRSSFLPPLQGSERVNSLLPFLPARRPDPCSLSSPFPYGIFPMESNCSAAAKIRVPALPLQRPLLERGVLRPETWLASTPGCPLGPTSHRCPPGIYHLRASGRVSPRPDTSPPAMQVMRHYDRGARPPV